MVIEAQRTEVIPGVHQLKIPIPYNPLGFINSYLVIGDKGCLLLDTGWNVDAAFDALTEQLASAGVGLRDLSAIVISHVHPDHYGLAGRIKKLCPAKIAFHHWERAFLESRYVHEAELTSLQSKMGQFLIAHGVPEKVAAPLQRASAPTLDFVSVAWPDEVLYGGEVFNIGEFELEVLWTPGHSPGHICLYEASKKLLFSGDHILPRITPNIGYHLQSGSNPLGEYINSLRMLEPLNVDLVLPAHEGVFGGMRQRIEQIIRHHREREEEILAIVADGPMTAYDIASAIPWRIRDGDWSTLHPFAQRSAVTETIAHLEHLRLAARLVRTQRDGVKYYGPPPVGA